MTNKKKGKSMSYRMTRRAAYRGTWGALVLPAISVLALNAAFAQTAGSPAAPAGAALTSQATKTDQPSSGVTGEIIVTAEKRNSTVQKTPLSITAISGAQLQSLGISSAQGIVKAVPGISVNSAGPGQARYEIRGLSSDGGEAATVGFYLDDIPITPPATATTGKSPIDPNLYDLSRVEVLRGPQGTLYGASSLGGTVKLVTNAPDATRFYGSAEGVGSGTEHGGGNYKGSGMLNIPLVEDQLAFRIVGTYQHDSGWLDRVIVPNFPASPDGGLTRGDVLGIPDSRTIKDVNDTTLYNLRASLLIKPTDRLTITPSVMYQTTRQGGQNTYDGVPGPPYFAHFEAFDIAEPYSDRFVVGSLPIVYDFGGVSLTSVSAYWERRSTQVQDATEQFVINVPFPAYDVADGGPGPSSVHESDKTHQFSQEVRLGSTGNGPIQWLIGGYYSDYFDRFHLQSAPPGTEAAFGTPILYNVVQPLRVRQKAVFGNVTWNITDKLKIQGGARYFSYTSTFGSWAFGYLYDPVTPQTNSTTAKAHGVNPNATISYQITPSVMFYGTASKGFREGAGNFPINTTGPGGEACLQSLRDIGRESAPLSFNPDTVWNYEIGEKARLFDNKVTFNSDIYLINWNKVQTPVALSCGLGFTTNGPKAQVKGTEIEMQLNLIRGLTISQSVGYADAKYVQDFPAAGIVDGERLLNAPHWTVATMVRLEQPLDNRYKIVALARNSYTSRSTDLTYQINDLPSRDDLSARLGLETDAWSAYLFVDNLLNQRQIISNINTLSYTGPPYNKIATNQPRTAGVDVNFKF
jgi:iron complex outermembrane receptor protein